MSNQSALQKVDSVCLFLYVFCVLVGLASIYSSIYNPNSPVDLLSFSNLAGKQFVWILTTTFLILIILLLEARFFKIFANLIYISVVFLLVLVLIFGVQIKGSHSWFRIGSFSFQPAEFSRLATALLLANYLSKPQINLEQFRHQLNCFFFLAIPALLILLSSETGSMLVFASFLTVLYREGLPGIYPFVIISAIILVIITLFVQNILYVSIGIGVLTLLFYFLFLNRFQRKKPKIIFQVAFIALLAVGFVNGIDFVMNNVLKTYQKKRIHSLFDPSADPKGIGWNVIQSKIAIGTGGFLGKGYLKGTQTKFDFVPEQSTDFIFCTIAEEFGFLGTSSLFLAILGLIFRIIYLAERQKQRFGRIIGYSLASVLFFHFVVNIGMTIGYMPVIGIPLPFISYGGSSLWAFSIFLFIFLKIDSHKGEFMSRL